MSDKKKLIWIGIGFLIAYFLPVNSERFQNAILETFHLINYYAENHVIFCLIPAFFIAGGISVFLSQDAIIKYLGPKAKKIVSYSVASVSGIILAVCSCTVLPLFAGIYYKGAGLGPAIAFLYSGPAINIMAITLTTNALGVEMGIARIIGAILFSFVIGFSMHLIYKNEENLATDNDMFTPDESNEKPIWKIILFFASMVGFLIFANLSGPSGNVENRIWEIAFSIKWYMASFFLILAIIFSTKWYNKEERKEWFDETKGFAIKIMPLLFIGIVIAGILLGRADTEGLIPSEWINSLVGGNSLGANLFASIAGAFMYFATLTEIPILEGLIGSGMGKGPALALLLAGPALSLPNMLVIRSIIGTKKTITFVTLVIIMSTIAGLIYGNIF